MVSLLDVKNLTHRHTHNKRTSLKPSTIQCPRLNRISRISIPSGHHQLTDSSLYKLLYQPITAEFQLFYTLYLACIKSVIRKLVFNAKYYSVSRTGFHIIQKLATPLIYINFTNNLEQIFYS